MTTEKKKSSPLAVILLVLMLIAAAWSFAGGTLIGTGTGALIQSVPSNAKSPN